MSIKAVALFERAVAQAIALLERDPHQVRRAKNAEKLANLARDAMERFGEQRSAALTQLRDDGWSLADMREEFGIARARLSQLINRDSYRQGRKERRAK